MGKKDTRKMKSARDHKAPFLKVKRRSNGIVGKYPNEQVQTTNIEYLSDQAKTAILSLDLVFYIFY